MYDEEVRNKPFWVIKDKKIAKQSVLNSSSNIVAQMIATGRIQPGEEAEAWIGLAKLGFEWVFKNEELPGE